MYIEIAFFFVIILIIYPFAIYPVSIIALSLLKKKKEMKRFNLDELPFVSLIITAYNEEVVILRKLEETLKYNYPRNKFEVIVVSDDSDDKTNEIVTGFISSRKTTQPGYKFLCVEGRKGKTFCQNYATKQARGEILAFSDSNSQWNPEALLRLVEVFKDDKIGYVSGNLVYLNSSEDLTSHVEGLYWNFDIKLREIESNLSSIVGGNGAIYAIRKGNYVNLPPLLSHDGFMPTKIVLQGMKAKFVKEAVAGEYASTDSVDEFQRKVRMQRGQPWKKYYDFKKFNIFKYGLFTYFYIGHKFLKYILYLTHPALFVLNVLIFDLSILYKITLFMQVIFYIFSIIGYILRNKTKIKVFYYPYHYMLTVIAQFVSVINTFSGKSKPTWSKSKTTRK